MCWWKNCSTNNFGKIECKIWKTRWTRLIRRNKTCSKGFGSKSVNVIKKTKLDDWIVKSDDEKLNESQDSPVALKNDKTEEQLEIVCEESKMEVNDKVVVHEKITID